MGGDFFVHQRLGERGRVLLVVAEFAKAHDIDHDIHAEFHAVFQRPLHGQDDGLGVVAVDMQDRGFDHLDHVGAVHAGAGVARVRGGKANLVVDHDVHRAARGVATGLGQRQRLLNNALAGKSCVAVYQHRQHLLALGVASAVHAGAHRAFDHGVDDFQVRGVESQTQMHRATGGGHVGAEALVVFHVARGQFFGRCVVELGEQIRRLFAHGIDQHVQAAAVRHAYHDLLHAALSGRLDQLVHGSDEAFTTFQREALLAHVFGVQKTLQTFGGGEVFQDVLFLLGREVGFAAHRLQALLPPAFVRLLAGVHELGTQRAAVGFAQRVHQLAQGHVLLAKEGVAGVENGLQVGVRETIKRRVQVGDRRPFGALQGV